MKIVITVNGEEMLSNEVKEWLVLCHTDKVEIAVNLVAQPPRPKAHRQVGAGWKKLQRKTKG